VTEPIDDQLRVRSVALELFILADGVELIGGAVELDVPVQVGVRLEKDDVELLDAGRPAASGRIGNGIVDTSRPRSSRPRTGVPQLMTST